MSLWGSVLRPWIKPLVYRLRSATVYRAAAFYVNAVDNDNDGNFETNGEAAFARAHLRGAKIAIDAGAAKGHWTALALAADPHVQVHCFEPTARRFQLLVDSKFGARAVLNRVGLGAKRETMQIHIEVPGGSNSAFAQEYAGEHRPVETVPVTTIDEYCAEHGIAHVDFVKLDIEGYEVAALHGAERMLRAGQIDVVQFEYGFMYVEARTSLLDLMQYIRGVNPRYVFHKLYPDGARPVTTYSHELDNFKTQNWALIKS